MMYFIDVVAAVIERNDQFLVTRRPTGTHLEGLWEFPGGKCESGEAAKACLRREVEEELGLRITVDGELLTTIYTDHERTIRLRFFRCRAEGDPVARIGQQMRWVTRIELSTLEFPPADAELIRLLADEH